ncbi:MAG: hypothetical protein IJ801_08645 [Lachnospiraceae bacterium]|nr:hypothetical protein [Lachnospiraceae bacterium]
MKAAKERNRLVVLVWLLVLGGCLLSLPVQAAGKNGNMTKKVKKENQDFKVSVTYGIDGLVVYDSPALVQIRLESSRNFTGTIQLIPVMYYGRKTVAYGQDIALSAGEAKTFYFVPSAVGNTGEVTVQIVDEKDKIVYAEQDTVEVIGMGENGLAGILSDDYSALNYLDATTLQLSNDQVEVSIVELSPDDLQVDSSSISILNYILIDNFDTAKLSDEQYMILKDWVNKGGVLILSLGANYQNVLHRFSDDFITGTFGNLKKQELRWEVTSDMTTEQDGQEGILTLPEVDVVPLSVTDAMELGTFSQDQTAYKKRSGAGTVVVLSYALGMEPMTSFQERKKVAEMLLKAAIIDKAQGMNGNGIQSNMMDMSDGAELAKLADQTRKPSVLLYGGLLFCYVILVGPVLYLVLKTMKKREKIWIAIPAMSCAFTVLIYLTGFLYRVRVPIVNTFSLLHLQEGMMEEQVYTSVTCPEAKDYVMTLKKDYTGFKNDTYSYDYDMFSSYRGADGTEGTYDYMIKTQNDGMEVLFHTKEAFAENSFMVSRITDNPIGMVTCDLHCYTDGFEGTITNNTNYDLVNVVVNFETCLYQAGDLKKGGQVTIDRSKLIKTVGYGTFSGLYNSYNTINTNREVYRKFRVDSIMEEDLANAENYNTGCVWAMIDAYEPQLSDSKNLQQNGHAVIYQTFSAAYEDIEGVYYPNLSQMIVATQGDYDKTDATIYDSEATITYSFENFPGITTLENEAYGQTPSSYGVYADVYAYNADSGAYEQIFGQDSTLSGADLQKYINGNILILQYRTNSGETCYLPRISARGDQ